MTVDHLKATPPEAVSATDQLLDRYLAVRQRSAEIAGHLEPEDCMIQSMPEASPIRWHLAHTTWFFETFVLKRQPDYTPVAESFEYLFNSYYNSVSDQPPRDQRGVLSRPTVAEVLDYRQRVDRSIVDTWAQKGNDDALRGLIEIGLQHEQQHQELMLTDIKHAFSCNPLMPALLSASLETNPPIPQRWIDLEEGLYEIGHSGEGFAFDNESPRHRIFLEPAQLSSRLVTAGEYLEFIRDGGYQRPELWLSLGWEQVVRFRWQAPLYWRTEHGTECEYTLAGLRPLDSDQPVSHVSYFEADAFARWAGARLPTEAEWEVAATDCNLPEPPQDRLQIHPTHVGNGKLQSMQGSVWQWSSSAYGAYPGYQAPPGAWGEYNGKFMCNQYVLRGSSCATPPNHARLTYRNFFPPHARWQFTGIRLARS